MLYESKYYCPECDSGVDLSEAQMRRQLRHGANRRQFLGTLGAGAAAAAVATHLPASTGVQSAAAAERKIRKPSENLIRELFDSLSESQKEQLVFSWDHKRNGNQLMRLGTFNSAIMGKRMVDHIKKPQLELVERIVKSMLSGEESWERMTRYGQWDNSGSFDRCGFALFGDPTQEEKFSFVFSGHHLTLRCDGNSEPGAAFGGPIYYGHLVGGYSPRNVFHYQTRKVQQVFDALEPDQQELAIAAKNPGDRERGITFPEKGATRPGIGFSQLKQDQQQLVEEVMQTLLAPFRKADVDEVMQIVQQQGGLENIHLAFYKDADSKDDKVRWDFWRLEGPGFIWNYRVLPHVHCYVNIRGNA